MECLNQSGVAARQGGPALLGFGKMMWEAICRLYSVLTKKSTQTGKPASLSWIFAVAGISHRHYEISATVRVRWLCISICHRSHL